jgi:hypothetical protein
MQAWDDMAAYCVGHVVKFKEKVDDVEVKEEEVILEEAWSTAKEDAIMKEDTRETIIVVCAHTRTRTQIHPYTHAHSIFLHIGG